MKTNRFEYTDLPVEITENTGLCGVQPVATPRTGFTILGIVCTFILAALVASALAG